MKRNNQLHKGNVTGAGHGKREYRLGYTQAVASVPRNLPANRAIREIRGKTKGGIAWPVWMRLPNLTYNLFAKVGLIVPERSV